MRAKAIKTENHGPSPQARPGLSDGRIAIRGGDGRPNRIMPALSTRWALFVHLVGRPKRRSGAPQSDKMQRNVMRRNQK
jgi:hypothetical protein